MFDGLQILLRKDSRFPENVPNAKSKTNPDHHHNVLVSHTLRKSLETEIRLVGASEFFTHLATKKIRKDAQKFFSSLILLLGIVHKH